MSDIYVVVPTGYVPPTAHTTWQGAAMELVDTAASLGAALEVVNVELIDDEEE